jgi:hypothetical protein
VDDITPATRPMKILPCLRGFIASAWLCLLTGVSPALAQNQSPPDIETVKLPTF